MASAAVAGCLSPASNHTPTRSSGQRQQQGAWPAAAPHFGLPPPASLSSTPRCARWCRGTRRRERRGSWGGPQGGARRRRAEQAPRFAQLTDHPALLPPQTLAAGGSRCVHTPHNQASRPDWRSEWLGGGRLWRVRGPCMAGTAPSVTHTFTWTCHPLPTLQVPPGPAARRRGGRLVPDRGARHREACRRPGAVPASRAPAAGRRLAAPADLWRAGGGGRRARGACWCHCLTWGWVGFGASQGFVRHPAARGASAPRNLAA